MTQVRRSSKRKRGKAALALGAAGVSLAMTGAASATAPTTIPSQDNARRFILAEEEISDVSLATFQVFDRENPPLSQGIKLHVVAAAAAAAAATAAGAAGALLVAVALRAAGAPLAGAAPLVDAAPVEEAALALE